MFPDFFDIFFESCFAYCHVAEDDSQKIQRFSVERLVAMKETVGIISGPTITSFILVAQRAVIDEYILFLYVLQIETPACVVEKIWGWGQGRLLTGVSSSSSWYAPTMWSSKNCLFEFLCVSNCKDSVFCKTHLS